VGVQASLAGPVGLEVQAPWATLLLWGYKTVETRAYPLPPELIGREIFLVESAEGRAGVSAVADEVAAGSPGLRILGTVVFSGSIHYRDRDAWVADEYRHRVPSNSPYSWTKDTSKYGWVVQVAKPLATPAPVPAMRRALRSIFALDLPDGGSSLVTLKSRLGAPPPVDQGSIPLINLTPFVNGTEEEQQRVVDAVAAQCEYIGFLRVTWDDFPRETVERAQAMARALFQCSAEEKRQWSKSDIMKYTCSYTSTGYRGIGTTENNKNRESWSCTAPEYEPGAPAFLADYYTSAQGRQHFAAPPDPQVPWPDEARLPGFRRAVCEYHSEVEQLGRVLLRIFARVLDCEEATLLSMTDKHVSAMNLFSFTMGEGGEVLPAHADVSVFTILSHDTASGAAGAAALQMLTPDGQWEAVPSVPGTFLVNLGQIMQRWSNGRLRATIHRVVPPVGQVGTKRQTITFFQLLNYDASVSVLPECGTGEVKYEPLTVAEWTTKRLAGFYEPAATRDINKCWYNYNVDAYVV